ncbi:MAG: rod shape-determining protein MreC [Eubacteriales bacterium]|nr:rod shape-determining protein MreC [Eubacteriales bacterium]MDD3882780.1 rod shape-determining protein MreC [Eubacteriales bacterium]MDD4512950.1 rod shape-determining protein MreC [Eubacteriales bacterium]
MAKWRKGQPEAPKKELFNLKTTAKVAIAIVLAAIVGMSVLAQFSDLSILDAPRRWLSGIIEPIQSAFSSGVDGVVEYLYKLKLRSNIEYEYNQLRLENEQLTYQAMLNNEYEKRLQSYEEMLGIMDANRDMNGLVSTIIGRDTSNYFAVFQINKGTNDGVEDYMAVINSSGLIGYTYNTNATSAMVRGIIDSEASIAALIESSRDQGTISGTYGIDDVPKCRMFYLDADSLPRPGDTVATSGVGMEIPKGIPIGTVISSTRQMEDNKSYIVVEPYVDFQHLEYVMVLRYRPNPEGITSRSETDEYAYDIIATARPYPTNIGSVIIQDERFPVGTPTVTPEARNTPAPTNSPQPTQTTQNIQFHTVSTVTETPGIRGTDTPAPTNTPKPAETFNPDNIIDEPD